MVCMWQGRTPKLLVQILIFNEGSHGFSLSMWFKWELAQPSFVVLVKMYGLAYGPLDFLIYSSPVWTYVSSALCSLLQHFLPCWKDFPVPLLIDSSCPASWFSYASDIISILCSGVGERNERKQASAKKDEQTRQCLKTHKYKRLWPQLSLPFVCHPSPCTCFPRTDSAYDLFLSDLFDPFSFDIS